MPVYQAIFTGECLVSFEVAQKNLNQMIEKHEERFSQLMFSFHGG